MLVALSPNLFFDYPDLVSSVVAPAAVLFTVSVPFEIVICPEEITKAVRGNLFQIAGHFYKYVQIILCGLAAVMATHYVSFVVQQIPWMLGVYVSTIVFKALFAVTALFSKGLVTFVTVVFFIALFHFYLDHRSSGDPNRLENHR